MTIAVQLVRECIREVAQSEERLLLIVGSPGSGKSKVMRELASIRVGEYIGAETLITQELFELLPGARRQQAPQMLDKQLARLQADTVLLDDIQKLFAPVLNLDTLALLRQLSRKYTIVAAWPGECRERKLTLFCNGHKMEYDAENIRTVEID